MLKFHTCLRLLARFTLSYEMFYLHVYRGHKHFLGLAYSKCSILKNMCPARYDAMQTNSDLKKKLRTIQHLPSLSSAFRLLQKFVPAQRITRLLSISLSMGPSMVRCHLPWPGGCQSRYICYQCLVRSWPFTGIADAWLIICVYTFLSG